MDHYFSIGGGASNISGILPEATLKYPKAASMVAAFAAVMFVGLGVVGKSYFYATFKFLQNNLMHLFFCASKP